MKNKCRAEVLSVYPGAYALHLPDTGIWQIWGGKGDAFPEPLAEASTRLAAWLYASVKLPPGSSLADLTPDQQIAIRDYAAWAGPEWRKQLLDDWMRAGSRFPGEYAYLQQIRNQHGPRWLAALPSNAL